MDKNLICNLDIIREIGKGGFGVVYLAKDKNDTFFALKKVKIDSASYSKKELKALETYQKFVKNNKAENLIQILDIKITDDEISYLMPLADGVENISPLDENWQAMTLKSYVEQRYENKEVFTKDDVLKIFLPLFETVAKLNEAGIVHRDIKPENIIFANGKVYLADIGLIREDTYSASSAGTPHYTAPSWYTKNAGKVDMWGLASTLYFFLSGNPPDSMGRTNYMYPSHKDKMNSTDIQAWQHFHRVILRATREKSNERYITLYDFIDSFKNINKKEIDYSQITAQIRTSIFWINGRINRLYFSLCYIFMCFFAFLIAMMIFEKSIVIRTIGTTIVLFINWFTITLMIKRIHDSGSKAYWGFLIYLFTHVVRYSSIFCPFPEETASTRIIIHSFADISMMIFSLVVPLLFKSEKCTNKYGAPNQRLSIF